MESAEMSMLEEEECEEFLGFTGEEIERSSKAAVGLKAIINVVTKIVSSKFKWITKHLSKKKRIKKEEPEPVRRYPRRNVARVDYREKEVPDDDDYIYCDDCQMEWEGDCPHHGPLTIVKDTEVVIGPEGKPGPKYAMSTIPNGLEIAPSQITEAGLGVWTKDILPQGLRFGPYGGVKVLEPCKRGYCWEIKKEKKVIYYIDAYNPTKSNWMRYVNCARHEEEQNLVAFQYKGEIYYRTTQDIMPGVELLVWYGDDYGLELGIDIPSFHRTIQRGQRTGVTSSVPSNLNNGCNSNSGSTGFLTPSSLPMQSRSMLCLQRERKTNLQQRDSATSTFSEEYVDKKAPGNLQQEDAWNMSSRCEEKRSILNDNETVCSTSIGDGPAKIIRPQNHENGGIAKGEAKSSNSGSLTSSNSLRKFRLNREGKIHLDDGKRDAKGSFTVVPNKMKKGVLYNKEKYCCHECSEGFRSKKLLVKHLEKHFGANIVANNYSSTNNNHSKLVKHGVTLRNTVPREFQGGQIDANGTSKENLKIIYSVGCREEHIEPKAEDIHSCKLCGKKFPIQPHLKAHILETHLKKKYNSSEIRALKSSGKVDQGSEDRGPWERVHQKSNEQGGTDTRHEVANGKVGELYPGKRPISVLQVATAKETVRGSASLSGERRIPMFPQSSHKNDDSKNISQPSWFSNDAESSINEGKHKTCSVCSKSFSRSDSLRRHLLTHTGEKPYSCSVCSKSFSVSSQLRLHMRTHTGEKPYSCSVCSKSFSHSNDLHKHMRTHTGEKPYSCSVCSKSFSVSSQLRPHMRTHTGEKPYSCSVCSKSFSHSNDLHKHMRTHTGEKPYSCSVCSKSFSVSSQLRPHMRTHTGEKPYSCSVCSKSFSQSSDLHKHMRTHTGEKPYSCSVCSKSFSHSNDLHKHMRTHTGEKPYSCSVCSKSFSVSSQLRPHMRTHTGEKPYSCSVCSKSFSQSSDLHKHMRTHTGEKPYSCSVCSKSFSHSNDLHKHMRTHTGEKPYSCSVCSKSFSVSSQLRPHMRTHTGEKPYSCSVCSKSFSQSSDLHKHMRTHTGEKPYSCSVCSKSFSQSSHLHKHMRTHTSEKPYSCSVCSKSFSQSSHLHKHMRTHTSEKPYSCSVCSKSFSQSSLLHSHVMRVHKLSNPYRCHHCSYVVDSKSSLRKHILNSHLSKEE